MAERPIDIVHGIKPRPATLAGPGGAVTKNPIDAAIELRQKRLANDMAEHEFKLIDLKNRRDELALEKETKELARGISGEGADDNPALALVAKMVREGVDSQKAVAVIQGMTPQQQMALWSMAQSKGSGPYMASFIAAAQSANTSPRDAVKEFKEIYGLFKENMPQQQRSSLDDFRTLYDMVKPGKETDDVISNLNARQEQLERELAAEREERHRLEVKNAEDMAALRQQGMESKIKELSEKVDQSASKDPFKQFDQTVDQLKKWGMPIAIGATEVGTKSPLEETKELIETVMKTPGVERMTDAAADRIRQGAVNKMQQRQPAVTATGLPPGAQVLCDNCLAQGRKTPLPITPAVMAGREPAVCPVCRTSYWRGAPPSGAGPSGQPPPGPDDNRSDNRPPFPGRF